MFKLTLRGLNLISHKITPFRLAWSGIPKQCATNDSKPIKQLLRITNKNVLFERAIRCGEDDITFESYKMFSLSRCVIEELTLGLV